MQQIKIPQHWVITIDQIVIRTTDEEFIKKFRKDQITFLEETNFQLFEKNDSEIETLIKLIPKSNLSAGISPKHEVIKDTEEYQEKLKEILNKSLKGEVSVLASNRLKSQGIITYYDFISSISSVSLHEDDYEGLWKKFNSIHEIRGFGRKSFDNVLETLNYVSRESGIPITPGMDLPDEVIKFFKDQKKNKGE